LFVGSFGGEVRIIPVTAQSAEVHFGGDGAQARIGDVGAVGPRWWWQHRDGERSSAVAKSRLEAAQALADYHLAFKQPSRDKALMRHRLVG
jgi:hypothetical protein